MMSLSCGRERVARGRVILRLLGALVAAPAAQASALDLIAPSVGITQPANGSIQSSLPSLSGTAFDSVAVASVTVSVRRHDDWLFWDGVAWTASQAWFHASVSSLTWTYSSVPSWVSGSTYTINAKAMDTSGNWSANFTSSTFVYGAGNAPPAALTDLTAAPGGGVGALLLTWSAPGADGNTGVLAGAFLIQHSTFTGISWSTTAAQVVISTSGVIPGTARGWQVSGLQTNTTYYFKLWTRDEAANYSGVSNQPSAVTPIGTPSAVYFDEVSSNSITASAYLADLPGLSSGQSGVNVAINGAYSAWRSGDVWAAKAALPTTRDALEAAVIGGKLYAVGGEVGGSTFFNTNEEYDPAANAWTTKAAMPTARAGIGVGVINGRLYVAGGGNLSILAVNEVYDPVSNSWATKAPMSVPRSQLTAKAVGGKLYVLGGHDGASAVPANEEYDPESDTWSLKAPLPTPRYQLLSAVVNGRLYTLGGIIGNSSATVNTNEEFDPVLNTWSSKTPMPTTRYAFATGVIGGKVYAAGGYSLLTGGGPHLSANEEYDPATDNWATRAPLPTARRETAGEAIGGKLYVIGGYNGTPKNTNEAYDPGVAFIFPGLAPNTQYSFRAKARNLAGLETGESVTVSTWTLANAPSGLSAIPQATGAALSWGLNGNSGMPWAQIYRSTDNAAFSLLLSTPALSFTDPGLQPGGTYYYRVRNFNGGGVPSAYSATAGLVTTAAAISSAPFSGIGISSLTVNWGTSHSAGTVYYVRLASAPSDSAFIYAATTTAASHTFSGITANTSYYGYVSVSSASGYIQAGAGSVLVETPSGVLFDEVGASTIVASAYAASPAFTGLDRGVSGVNVALDGVYGSWTAGNSWTARAAMPTSRTAVAAAVAGGKAYFMGGWNGTSYLNTNEEYDPVANAWTPRAAMPVAYRYFGIGSIGGKIYAVGGINSAGTVLNTNRVYDPASNTWSTKAAMPTARYSLEAGVANGKLYAIGGINTSPALSANEEYDPDTDAWTAKAPLPTARYALTVAPAGGRLYALGGYNGSSALNTNEEYDPSANVWAVRAALPAPRSHLASGVIGGKILAVGGYTGSANVALNEEYDPAANNWTSRSAMPAARRELAVAVAGGKLYAVGGWGTGSLTTNAAYTPGTASSFTGLFPNTQYTFKAKARGQDGIETGESVTVSTWTLANVPSGLAAVPHVSSATLTWGLNGNPPGTLAQVYRSTDGIAYALVLSTPALSFTDTGLQSFTTYYYSVLNFNGAGVPTSNASVFSRTRGLTATVTIETPALEMGIYKRYDVLNVFGIGENLRENAGVQIRIKRLKEPVAWWYEPTLSWVESDTFTFVSPFGVWVQSIDGPAAFTEDLSSYTVTVTGYNTGGEPQPVPAVRTFIVDASLPVSAVTVPASGSTVGVFSGLSGTAYDIGGVDSVVVKVRRLTDGQYWDGAAWTSTEEWNLAAGTAAWTYAGLPQAALTSGVTYFAVARAADAAGNEQAFETGGSTFTYLVPVLSGLPFSGVGVSSLTVNWAANFSGGTVYAAILSTMPAPVPVFGATTTALSQTFTGLAPNTSYYGYVSTTPGSGYTLADVRATLAVVPSTPAFTAVYYSSFVFTWSAGQNPASGTGYQYNISQSTSFSPSFSGSGPVMTVTITGRAEGGTWYARVRAVNQNGIPSPYAYAGPITTLIAPASGTVTGLAGTALGTSSVSWHWGAGSVTQATGFGVLASSGGALGAVAFSTAGASFVQTGLTPNMAASVRVGAYTAGGYGGLTASATYYTLAAVPAAIAVTGRTDAQVSLGWTANGNPAGTLYQLLRSSSADFMPAVIATTTAVSHDAAGLLAGAVYHFKVRAVNGDGILSGFSAAVSTSTLPPLPERPAAPAGAVLGVSSISWTWAAVPGASAYYVHPATAPAAVSASPAGPAFAQENLAPNTTYSVTVSALNDSGESQASPAAIPVATLANMPSGLTLTAVHSTSATLAWGLNGNPAGTAARVRRVDGPTFSTVGIGFTDTGLLGCSTYYFRVWNINRDGLATEPAQAGPVVTGNPVPLPPGNLSALSLAGGRIFLSWEPAPFEGITGYNLYFDNGTGTIDYATPIVLMTALQTSYTTPVLNYGTVYKYGLRAAHRCGAEEKNTYVRASAAALASLTGVRAAIKVPQSGKKVSGNSVTVMAELVTGTQAETLNLRFQYRASGAGVWFDIPAKDPANHPNPDTAAPYFIHWDVTGLTPGAYELRVVATDLGYMPDTTPAAIMITVDPAEADIVENVSGGKVTKSQTVNNLVTNTLQAADAGSALVTRLEIPPGALDNSTATVAVTNNPTLAPPPPADAEPVGVMAEVVLSNQSALAGGQIAAVTLPYPDADGDGMVDGTTMHANQLVMYSAHNAAGPWQRDLSSVVDVGNKKVTGYTSHFSFFALFAPLAADLNSARAYPVPWKPGSGGRFDSAPGTDGIIFDNLTDNAEIRIFTITGQLVREYKLTAADLGFKVWDGKNSAGQKAGSGVYLAHIKAGSKTKIIKVAVER